MCFHAAYSFEQGLLLRPLIIGYVICLVQLARLHSPRVAFYLGLATGFLCFAPQLIFFWTIFGAAALVLWLILALWIALFVAVARMSLVRFGLARGALLIPFVWTGLEYTRSELYALKFSWLNTSYALAGWHEPLLPWLGMYGVGFVVAALASAWLLARYRLALACATLLLLALLRITFESGEGVPTRPDLRLAGIQLEFPSEQEIRLALDRLLTLHPATELVVLSEYTLDGPVPPALLAWCKKSGCYLIVGGKDPAVGGAFFNTAFVVSPAGEVVFRQAKSVPIPFFNDGVPATQQAVWKSPWGKIGICICYDLSYRRVTDQLIYHGAQLLIVPTMDVTEWGMQEHRSNARVAPVRAAEYGVPIFRLASSGISQAVTSHGLVTAEAAYPGQGEILYAEVHLPPKGRVPLDRWLAPLSVGIAACLLLLSGLDGWARRKPAGTVED